MIRRLAFVTCWLLAVSGLAGGVYWGFLNTPESSAGALGLSAALALATFALAAIAVNGALLGWSAGWSSALLRRSVGGIPAFVPAVLLFAGVWWGVSLSTQWVAAHNGQISAWFIATLGWADVSRLFIGVDWAGRWLRWIAAPCVALGLLGAWLESGHPAGVAMRAALSPWRLLRVTVWGALFVALPWMYLVPWRPLRVPATSIEPAFVGGKLLIAAVIMAVGAALIIRDAAGPPREEAS